MKRNFTILICLIFSIASLAQTIEWETVVENAEINGNNDTEIKLIENQIITVADNRLLKLNKENGKILLNKEVGFTSKAKVASLADFEFSDKGNLIVSGIFYRGNSAKKILGDVDYDLFIQKISENGEPEWTRMIGEIGFDRVVDLEKVKNGYLVSGVREYVEPDHGTRIDYPYFVLFSENGKIIWESYEYDKLKYRIWTVDTEILKDNQNYLFYAMKSWEKLLIGKVSLDKGEVLWTKEILVKIEKQTTTPVAYKMKKLNNSKVLCLYGLNSLKEYNNSGILMIDTLGVKTWEKQFSNKIDARNLLIKNGKIYVCGNYDDKVWLAEILKPP